MLSQDREITIYDIARVLEISPSTVSRALNGNTLISDKTRKKIIDKARDLGYRSNYFASNLRNNKTFTIGLLVHELSSTFMLNVLMGVEKETADTGYNIIIAHSGESGSKEVSNANTLFHKRVDGLIASLAFDSPNLSHFHQFIQKKVPVVFFDRVEESQVGGKIIIDNFKAGYAVTRHLIEQGCRRIAHVTGSLKRNVYDLRYKGYRAALNDHGIRYDDSLLLISDLDKKGCLDAATELSKLKYIPDGLFTTSDFSAAICIQKFKASGLKVPDDIAVAGFNNDAISTIIEPNLTTINYSGFNIGQTAARILIGQLTGDNSIAYADTITLPAELIIRESTKRKANGNGTRY
jgi:LacI family transcriptional regulator